jgi:hypothetical protein
MFQTRSVRTLLATDHNRSLGWFASRTLKNHSQWYTQPPKLLRNIWQHVYVIYKYGRGPCDLDEPQSIPSKSFRINHPLSFPSSLATASDNLAK